MPEPDTFLGFGSANVIHGSAGGLDPATQQVWRQGTDGIEDFNSFGDRFATALDAADFNGDGSADLTVGVPYENIDGVNNAGMVHTIYGSFGTVNAGRGDFDGDGTLTTVDIDLLSAAAASGNHAVTYDLTADGLVDQRDVVYWVETLFGTIVGDANLDQVVDASDFNLWNSHKFTTTSDWSAGNFNADSVVDASDFNLWNSHKFQSAVSASGLQFDYRPGLLDAAFADADDEDEFFWRRRRQRG